jgi:cytochrome c peroxidase
VQDAALLHWLDSVPELPALADARSAAAVRGRALFEGKAQCTACHEGTHLTNNKTVDVGTGGPLQVPSLRGVGWRAPFLHDGRAATLKDRFDGLMGGGDQHGKTSQLAPGDITDLTAYLDTL